MKCDCVIFKRWWPKCFKVLFQKKDDCAEKVLQGKEEISSKKIQTKGCYDTQNNETEKRNRRILNPRWHQSPQVRHLNRALAGDGSDEGGR